MARVFSQKHSSTSMGNVGIYSVGTESVYQKWQFGKAACLRVSHEKALPARHSRNTTVSILSWLFTFQLCARHMHHFAGCLLASYPRKHFSLNLPWVFTLSLSHTTFTNKSHMKYRVQKIEQNYNQIWHGIKANKTHSCKLQLYTIICSRHNMALVAYTNSRSLYL